MHMLHIHIHIHIHIHTYTHTECRIAILGPHDADYMSMLSHLPPQAKVVVKGKTVEDFEVCVCVFVCSWVTCGV